MSIELNELKNGVMEVVFDKLNGERRVMLCTQSPEHIPSEMLSTEKREMLYNDNQVRVYDLEKNAWRSFLRENIISARSVNV
jgi:hypothetical protein